MAACVEETCGAIVPKKKGEGPAKHVNGILKEEG
jgi:hypothetical protein